MGGRKPGNNHQIATATPPPCCGKATPQLHCTALPHRGSVVHVAPASHFLWPPTPQIQKYHNPDEKLSVFQTMVAPNCTTTTTNYYYYYHIQPIISTQSYPTILSLLSINFCFFFWLNIFWWKILFRNSPGWFYFLQFAAKSTSSPSHQVGWRWGWKQSWPKRMSTE